MDATKTDELERPGWQAFLDWMDESPSLLCKAPEPENPHPPNSAKWHEWEDSFVEAEIGFWQAYDYLADEATDDQDAP